MKPDTDQPPMSKSVVKRLQAQGADQPVVADGCTCSHICPPRHEREIDDEVQCIHADYCPLSDNFAAQPSPTPADEVNRRAWQPIGTHPTHDDDVLLLMPDGDIVIGFWRDDAKAWDNTESGWIRETPARWASLPELPPDFTTDVEGEDQNSVR